MTDVVLNLNCSEHAIYSRILSDCVYIIKYGLNSPEIFLRRVNKRQAKRLRKKGVNINAKGFEYAVAENILYNLKVLPAPLIPATMYSKLRQLLDIYGTESRSRFITDAFKDTNSANIYVLQVLLKTMSLLGTFEKPWICPCGKDLDGNGLSWTMVALPITSYIMRERCLSTGHWFVSWGQQASDVEVVKILIKHWQDIHNVSATSLPIIRPTYPSTVRTWYCHLTHGLHLGIEPKEIPILEVENIITPVSFKQTKTPTGDFDISLYSISNDADNPDNTTTNNSNFNTATTLDSLDQLYMDNMENLQSLKNRLDSLSSNRSVTSSTKSGYTDNCDLETDERCSDVVSFMKWMTESRKLESIWSNHDMGDNERDEMMETENGDNISALARNVVAGCGGGTYDLWGDYIPPPADTVASETHSNSYWSDYTQMSKREILVSRLRHVIQRSLRKTKEKLQAEAKIQTPQVESIIAVNADSPRLIAPPAKTSSRPSTSTSRILELLVKSNPITDISELEKLADKLSATKSTQSNYGDCSSNPFNKPPHLIREFVPKQKMEDYVEYAAHSAPQLDLKPIKLTVEPYQKPVISINLDSEHYSLNDLDLNMWPNIVSGYYQPEYPAYHPGTVPTLQYIGAGPPTIPPIPKELESTTPPNLPTVIMLSQLFSANS